MPPTPTPQPVDISNTRDAAHLSNYTDAEFYINRLNDSDWALTREDLTEWLKVKNKITKIKGEGLEINKADLRLILTNRIRGRFGLLPLDENGRVIKSSDFGDDCGGTESVPVGWVF